VSTKPGQLQILEREEAEGKPFNPIIYSMLTNTLSRALKVLGLKAINARQTITVVGSHLPDLPLPEDDSANPTYQPPPEGAHSGATAPSPFAAQATVLRLPEKGVA
jgi:hypothetical protein